ncbi:MAG: PIG-L family deacetylase [Candidatus Eisenbacteria bacterium]
MRPIPFARFAPAFAALLAFAAVVPSALADPRPREVLDAARLRLALQKLQVTGSALFVAAHPDDENTAMLAWLSNGRKVRTGYLSMTRGDGGQNLIGTEFGEQLGLVRTQELLGARRVDGAEQFFTRALDFGFSKGPDETFAFWGRERVLADVVYVIRRFRPDVIVTRFPTDGGGGHGHHTASAILAEEAFAAAADPARFPEQLATVKPWQAKRLVWNAFRFGNAPPDTTPGRIRVDVGAYQPLLGRSFSEIAGESRSMHKSQGFGSAERRGELTNTFEHRLGARANAELFEGVDLSWGRFPNGARVAALLREAEAKFDPAHPEALLPVLLKARDAMAACGDDPLVGVKRAELMDVIRSCAGLWLEAVASRPTTVPGGRVRVVTSVLDRTGAGLTLEKVEIVNGPASTRAARPLARNLAASDTLTATLAADAPLTQPWWLSQPGDKGAFAVPDQKLVGDPESAPALLARFTLAAGASRLQYDVPVVSRSVDPVLGERYRALEVVPPVTSRFEQGAYLFADAAPRDVRVVVESSLEPLAGTVKLSLPAGWRAEPAARAITLSAQGDTTLAFRVTPPAAAANAPTTVRCIVESDYQQYDRRLVRIDHEHIPVQTLLPAAEAKLVRADVKHAGANVAYVMGSGDAVPAALAQMGWAVTLLSDADVEEGDLSKYDAVVIGVRAYNTRPRLLAHQDRLLAYAANGGRLVVQYQTADASFDNKLGPLPFKISRDRVTDETAAMRVRLAGHPLLTTPNAIGDADFAGWVQERGLYYAQPFDAGYDAVFGANDAGEPSRDGGLIVAKVGKGTFVYTGLAFFRQLPAGVPGAYRLFANLVSSDRR